LSTSQYSMTQLRRIARSISNKLLYIGISIIFLIYVS